MKFTTLFVDIGGVLLNNGWDGATRERAAKQFNLDFKEMDKRHRLTFDTYEIGKITLEEYVERVVFNTKRSFTVKDFIQYMYQQSRELPEMLAFVKQLKKRYQFKVVAVSNEGRELTTHRIKQFRLDELYDFFICSCFVNVRKPDTAIYKYALDLSYCTPDQVLYIDDREMFIEVAGKLGIQGIHHTSFETTRKQLASCGLK